MTGKSKFFYILVGGLFGTGIVLAVWWFYFGHGQESSVLYDSVVQIESISGDMSRDTHKSAPKAPKPAPKGNESSVGKGTGTAFRHVSYTVDGKEILYTLVFTAAHVVEGSKQIIVHWRGENIELVPADIIATDNRLDLAVIQVPRNIPIVMMFFGDVYNGERELAVGNPFGQGLMVTDGFIGEIQSNGLRLASASVWPGNSGGPVFIHRDGQYLFIGVIVKVFVVPNGLGYTIVNTLTYFVPMPMVQEFLVRSGINLQ